MALKKKQISYLLVAALAGGTIIGEGIGLYNLNNDVKELHKENIKLEQSIDNQNKTIKEKDSTIDSVTKERDNIKDSNEKLQKEKKVLEEKLEAKREQESSAGKASADYPTSNSNGVKSGTPVQMTLTFYGGGAEENGGYAGMNAYSQKLTAGTVASNVYPRGTKFVLPSGKTLTVNDTGGGNFNSYNRLDVYVPRHDGESKDSYDRRISNLGKKTLTVYKQ